MKNYYKNFILCGELDYHCLICQESFLNVESVDKHLKWEKHRKSLKKHEYDGPYSKDFIFKVREDYYCEVCNELTTDAKGHRSKVSHVNAKSNPESAIKKSLSIIKNSDGTISMDNFKINLLEWHGIKNDYCTLCGRVIRDISIHITLKVHIINMIHSKTKAFQNHYYRQIRDDKLYCFLCGQLFCKSKLETHWSTDCDATFKVNVTLSETDRNIIKNDPELANALLTLQKAFFKIDENKNRAQCLQCGEIVQAVLEFMLKHRNKHTSKQDSDSDCSKKSYEVQFTEVVDHGKRRNELAQYGKVNFIKLNESGSWGYCTLCGVSISAHMKQAMEHVQGQRHKGFLELKEIRKSNKHTEPNCIKQKITAFLKHIYRVESQRMYYVKDHIPLTDFCFMLMTEYGKKSHKMKCFACDELVDKNDAVQHYKTKIHIDKVLACHVMLVEGGFEFIRMIRRNLYHCGICNILLPYWESVRRHITGFPHSFKKSQKILRCNEAREMRNTFGYRNSKGDLNIQLKRLGLA